MTSNKVIPPTPSQTVLPTTNQVLKYMGPSQIFLFKPPQSSRQILPTCGPSLCPISSGQNWSDCFQCGMNCWLLGEKFLCHESIQIFCADNMVRVERKPYSPVTQWPLASYAKAGFKERLTYGSEKYIMCAKYDFRNLESLESRDIKRTGRKTSAKLRNPKHEKYTHRVLISDSSG